MEDKNKKLFSTILMVVGTIFILVSGGIFVSSTWQYMPEGLKKFCLLLVTAGCFAGSEYVKRKWELKKTSFTLNYLGVGFLGYTSYSFLRMANISANISLLLMIGIMAIPMTIHFLRNRNILDFVLEIGLIDTAMILMTSVLSSAYPHLRAVEIALPTMSFVTLLMAAGVYVGKKYMEEETVLNLIATITAVVHMAIVTCMASGTIFETNFLVNGLPMVLMAVSVTALYAAYENTVSRVFQSMYLFAATFTLTLFALQNLIPHEDALISLIFLIPLVVNLGMMIVLDRTEMFVLNICGAGMMGFVQMVVYMVTEERGYFYPYVFCMAAALVLSLLVKKTEHLHMCNWKVIMVWVLFGCNNLIAYFSNVYADKYVFWMWLAILMFLLSVISEEYRVLEALFRSFSLLFVYGCLLCNTVGYFNFYKRPHWLGADFTVEYACLATAVFVVLLCKIWYDIFEEIRRLQFSSFCGILVALLCSNIYKEELPNVMFLAVVSLLVLVLSTFFHKKNYAIASAVTLILVVLYLTKSFWLSIAWWVYLFVAGVGLILYAVKREKAE